MQKKEIKQFAFLGYIKLKCNMKCEETNNVNYNIDSQLEPHTYKHITRRKKGGKNKACK